VRQFRIVRNNQSDASLSNELPRYLARASLEHIDELAFSPPSTIRALNAYSHPVTVEKWPHFAR
jgi:hypothetical protein